MKILFRLLNGLNKTNAEQMRINFISFHVLLVRISIWFKLSDVFLIHTELYFPINDVWAFLFIQLKWLRNLILRQTHAIFLLE